MPGSNTLSALTTTTGRTPFSWRSYALTASTTRPVVSAVDWRATAHTGDLQVREFARESERSVEIFLDRGVPPELAGWF